MLEILDDRVLLFTDLHVGIKGNSILRLDIAEELIDKIVETIEAKNIKHVIFSGDFHHERSQISVETLCRSIRMINKIADKATLYMILGNHDLQNNVSTEVNSIKFLKDTPNVHLIDKPTEIMIGPNGQVLQAIGSGTYALF